MKSFFLTRAFVIKYNLLKNTCIKKISFTHFSIATVALVMSFSACKKQAVEDAAEISSPNSSVATSSVPSTSNIRSDGTILVNGEPFFPFGAYSIPFAESEANKTQALNDIIAAGFNISTVEDDGNNQTTRPMINRLLNHAAANNFKLLIGATNAPNGQWLPVKYKDYPATFGYIVADDADNENYTTAELAQYNGNIIANDANHVSFLTLTGFTAANRSQANSFTPISDISGYQCYPIGFHRYSDWTTGTALTETYLRTLSYVQSAAIVNRPMIMHLQTFNWGTQSDIPRYPTVIELRNMLYSGLAAGVKGILSYDYSFDLKNNQPALWNEFKALRADVQTLQGGLMNGQLTRQTTGDQEMVISYWTDATACYIVFVNTSYSNTKNVSFTFPSGYGNSVEKLFGTRMSGWLNLNNNVLNGQIQPQAVQVWKVGKI